MPAMVDKRILDVIDALQSSFDLNEVIRSVHRELQNLVPSDVVAMCVSRPQDALYDWFTTDCSTSFFDEYPMLANDDFVAKAVQRRPNQALLDEEMAPRAIIESNLLYRRAHELGLPLKQAMSVLIQCDCGHGGITMYRTRRRPFSERERKILQMLVRPLGHAISRARRFHQEAEARNILETCLSVHGTEVVVYDALGREQARSAGITGIASRWFSPHDFSSTLNSWWQRTRGWSPDCSHGRLHHVVRNHRCLEVDADLLPSAMGRRYVAISFQERDVDVSLSLSLANKLTPRQRQVTLAILQGWDNRLIAEQLGCAEGTVKKHVHAIFERLGVESRAHLHVLARSMDGDR